MMRLVALIAALILLVIVPFLFWGETFARWFSGDAGLQWLRGQGDFAWLAILGLLIGDLFLPIPATPLMSAAGYFYGVLAGGLLSATGSFLSGLLAYSLCRRFGHGAAVRLAGEAELARAERLFHDKGAWLVALSRWAPILPEVVACMAGLTRMPFRAFAIALGCGSLPLGFAYAAIGAAGERSPTLAFILSVVTPALLWFGWSRFLGKSVSE